MTILIIEYKYLTIEYSQIKIITEVDSSSQENKTFYAAENKTITNYGTAMATPLHRQLNQNKPNPPDHHLH